MDLKFHLMRRIIIVAGFCLMLVAAYVLIQTHQDARRRLQATVDVLARQTTLQLIRISTGTDLVERFPDWDGIAQSGRLAGHCIHFSNMDGRAIRNLCHGEVLTATDWPVWFERLYHTLFAPGEGIRQHVFLNHINSGTLTVTQAAEMEIAHAWQDLRALFGLTATTVMALCCVIYFSIVQAFRPVCTVLAGVETMADGKLAHRLPNFDLIELQRISTAVNRLAASLEQSLTDRTALNRQLLKAQEEERTHLARELHDEFGQCLAGINALAASITQTARHECPGLVAESERISTITQHILDLLRSLLLRLRPPGLEEFGLGACLHELVTSWDHARHGQTRFYLTIEDTIDPLPEPLRGNVYRIVQEGLTNAVKHAEATQVHVKLRRLDFDQTERGMTECLELLIEDNGATATPPTSSPSPGLGLLGIQERATALGGRLYFQCRDTGGLLIRAVLPLTLPAIVA